jgi:hypothetical protein
MQQQLASRNLQNGVTNQVERVRERERERERQRESDRGSERAREEERERKRERERNPRLEKCNEREIAAAAAGCVRSGGITCSSIVALRTAAMAGYVADRHQALIKPCSGPIFYSPVLEEKNKTKKTYLFLISAPALFSSSNSRQGCD